MRWLAGPTQQTSLPDREPFARKVAMIICAILVALTAWVCWNKTSEIGQMQNLLELCAVVLGSGIENIAGELQKYGPDKILVADDSTLADYTTDAYTNVIAELIQAQAPSVILIGATAQGKDLSARLAARLEAGLAMDCTAVKLENGSLTCTRPMFGGKIFADVEIEGAMQIIAVRPNVMDIAESAKRAFISEAKIKCSPSQ